MSGIEEKARVQQNIIKDERKDKMSNVIPKSGGPYSLFCTECGCWVPNTANHEMKKEGIYAYSHYCENGVCDMRNGEIKEKENETPKE